MRSPRPGFSARAQVAPWLVFLVGVSACSTTHRTPAHEPAPTPAPSTTPDVTPTAPRDAAADADPWQGASLLDRARARVGASVAVAWPGAGGFNDVTAWAGVSRTPSSRPTDRVIAWYRERDENSGGSAREYPVGPFAPTALATLDVNGDGRVELLAFGERAPVQDGAGGSVMVFDLAAERDQAEHLASASAALDGAHSVDEVRARLPLSNGLALADLASATALSVLGRLSFSSPAQLRAVMVPAGTELCTVATSNGRTTQRQCRRLTARTPDATLLRDLRGPIENAFALGVLTLSCEANARGETCTAQHAAGGQRVDFSFTGTGAARRLARVTSTEDLNAGE